MQSITRFCLLLAAVNLGGLAPGAATSALANSTPIAARHDHHSEHADGSAAIPDVADATPLGPPAADSSSRHSASASASGSGFTTTTISNAHATSDDTADSPEAASGSPPDHHHHHGPVKSVFDEAEIEKWHGKTPVSWVYYDWVLDPAERVRVSLQYGDVGRRTVLGRRHGGHEEEGEDEEDAEAMLSHGHDHEEDQSANWDEPADDEVPPTGGRRSDALAHPYIMLLHIFAFSSAFFVCLPLSLALRTARVAYFRVDARGRRRLHAPGAVKALADVGYWCNLVVGWFSGVWYRSATPNLYKGQVHSLSGYLLLLAVLALSFVDIISLGRRILAYTRLAPKQRGLEAFGDIVLSGLGTGAGGPSTVDSAGSGAISPLRLDGSDGERVRLAQSMEMPRGHRDEDEDEVDLLPESDSYAAGKTPARNGFASPWSQQNDGARTQQGQGKHVRILDMPAAESRRMSRLSNASDSTLRDSASPSGSDRAFDYHPTKASDLEPARRGGYDDGLPAQRPATGARKVVEFLLIFLNRALVVWAFIVAAMGVCVYTGVGRASYLPGLLAHWIKGSIFFWYGIVTFMRYLGARAEYGWAWNARPASQRASRVPSAEFVECAVIFAYGISNTWLERLGAAPGSPYSVKQVQHISIAIMFWFAGLIGMGMETKTLKRWLGAHVLKRSSSRRGAEGVEPATYAASFNPFPALVIGVLGIAMSAHHQDYEFQVTIHALWGYLLAGFALLRMLTYFFLYVAPMPSSVMPGRPPTEAMAAIALACGGVVFVLSDEEVTFAAMRHGWDDMMAFLNLTVAAVCLLFCWVLTVMVAKGWALSRAQHADDARQRAYLAEDEAEESALID